MSTRTLLGRERELAELDARVERGEVVLLYGRVGSGKTALLETIAHQARARSRPCALVRRTRALSDITAALATAYPSVTRAGPQRHVRSRLRAAAERSPGVLLFDGLGNTGTAFKGALKSLRGTGVAILLAADVDAPRDRERVRALALTHLEMELRPLPGSTMRTLLAGLLGRRSLPGSLVPEDVRALVAATEGLPGRAVAFAESLIEPTAWSGGRPRVDWLRMGAAIHAAERYRQDLERV